MSQPTELASGQITRSSHDVITVDYVDPGTEPAFVRIHWPAFPTVATRAEYPYVAAKLARIVAASSTALSHIKRERR